MKRSSEADVRRGRRIADYLLSEMVRSQACLEFAASKIYFEAYSTLVAQGARSAVSGKALELAEEEIDHYRLFRDLHESRWGEVDSIVARRVASLSLPSVENEADFLAARWIVDGTGLLQMRDYTGAGWANYKKAIRRAVRDEYRHKGEGKRAFQAAAKKRGGIPGAENLAKYAFKWLAVGQVSLGSSHTAFDRMAVDFRLKRRPAAEVKADLEAEVRGTLRVLGLQVQGLPLV